MYKKQCLLLVIITAMLSSFVVASLYAEKIPDPSRFTSIEPRWSAELKTSDGQIIKASLITFKWLSYQGNVEVTHMFYLNDGVDEYIAEKGSYDWEKISLFSCDEDYEKCVELCSLGDESCIDDCTIQFNCKTSYTCKTLAPDETCGIEGAIQDFGEHKLNLNFNASTGQVNGLMNYLDDQPIELIAQSGFLSEGVFSLE